MVCILVLCEHVNYFERLGLEDKSEFWLTILDFVS